MKSAPVRKKRCPKGTRRDKSGACVSKEQKDTKPTKPTKPFDFPDPQNLWGPFSGKDTLPPKKSPKKSPKTVKKRCPKGTRRDTVSGKCVGKFDKPEPKPKPKPKKTLKPCKPGQERHPVTNRCRKIQTKKATPKKKSAKTETMSLEEDMKYQPKKASPKPKPKPTETYFAKFYDISSEVDPEYETNGHLRTEMDNEQHIMKIINKHPEFKQGDVLFVGSSNETRQEYGFVIYLPEKKEKYMGGEDGVGIPLDIVRKDKDKNPLEHVRYSKLITDFMEDPPKGYNRDVVGLFMGYDFRDDEDINKEYVVQYKKEGIWD